MIFCLGFGDIFLRDRGLWGRDSRPSRWVDLEVYFVLVVGEKGFDVVGNVSSGVCGVVFGCFAWCKRVA
jgi:hypothetical protein